VVRHRPRMCGPGRRTFRPPERPSLPPPVSANLHRREKHAENRRFLRRGGRGRASLALRVSTDICPVSPCALTDPAWAWRAARFPRWRGGAGRPGSGDVRRPAHNAGRVVGWRAVWVGPEFRLPIGPWPGEKTVYFPRKTGQAARPGIWQPTLDKRGQNGDERTQQGAHLKTFSDKAAQPETRRYRHERRAMEVDRPGGDA
jgi:hypothetical protein